MTLTLLVGTVTLALSAHADSGRVVSKPVTNRATTVVPAAADSTSPVSAYDARLPTDSIVVEKSAHRLSLYQRGAAVRTYLVALGQQPVGDKTRIGDLRTPEGMFTIEARNPASRYHRSLRISYPDSAHRARARRLGVSPGGDIMIHGLPARQAYVGAAHRDFDWTEGCIAVTNAEIEEIWGAVGVGTRIHIKP
ncbi:MAG TPA: L,D-transpeptidase family protein [Gemmatimonadaceae bacterium]|nr:L,D-transpeptidase family protein [Gemmatimonadaceae bacterium]